MCYKITYKTNVPKIARKALYVYKTGGGTKNTFISTLYEYRYKKDELNKHIKIRVERIRTWVSVINQGYHSYTKPEARRLLKEYYTKIGLFEIPKGTLYYHAKGKIVIVSEQIIFRGWVTCVT